MRSMVPAYYPYKCRILKSSILFHCNIYREFLSQNKLLNEGKKFSCDVPDGHNSFIYLLKGELKIGEKNHTKTANYRKNN